MDNFQTVLSGLTEQIRGKEERWLQLQLLDSLWQVGEPATEENLHQYLPRLQMRSYPDGTIIMALDAQVPTEHQRGSRGRVLFGFGAGSLKRMPDDSWVWNRPYLDERLALAYELGRPAGGFENFREAPHPRGTPLPKSEAGLIVDLINNMVQDLDEVRFTGRITPRSLPLMIHQPQFPPEDFTNMLKNL